MKNDEKNAILRFIQYKKVKHWMLFTTLCCIFGSAIGVIFLTVIANSPYVKVGLVEILVTCLGFVNCAMMLKELITLSEHTPVNRLVFKLIYVYFGVRLLLGISSTNDTFGIPYFYMAGLRALSGVQLGVIITQILVFSIPVIVVIFVDLEAKKLAKYNSFAQEDDTFEKVVEPVSSYTNNEPVTQSIVEHTTQEGKQEEKHKESVESFETEQDTPQGKGVERAETETNSSNEEVVEVVDVENTPDEIELEN
ncbi:MULTISPECIES: hypothetical protein [unclassified Granulicatella]|uniref:hypothetical protein n=1 Tax=unclassified Granulicatella TaxID=2630493 RepID=UPI00107435E4|nr:MULTISPECIES: hypothetical protein [unclassified Granulicatella]MBF0780230.1 hypothetical protein [Granulicatella sp. 19428wC4_WM01]TFU95664.1 hypothetical protein E4T68_03880 [Granulicatella sp. WM01]